MKMKKEELTVNEEETLSTTESKITKSAISANITKESAPLKVKLTVLICMLLLPGNNNMFY